eukprot:TRINITY_DN3391_c0_g2_i2.p1 TRINITY_DN3391_c0_g2~~TRINITY_DN3391_c0_g2_i2.p1  ORF type:complete len:687 (-),score=107.34 TRINITY_DN3391_c0_g2_i2:260-2320(-)
MDEVRFWNRILTVDEIRSCMKVRYQPQNPAVSACPAFPSLLYAWSFDWLDFTLSSVSMSAVGQLPVPATRQGGADWAGSIVTDLEGSPMQLNIRPQYPVMIWLPVFDADFLDMTQLSCQVLEYPLYGSLEVWNLTGWMPLPLNTSSFGLYSCLLRYRSFDSSPSVRFDKIRYLAVDYLTSSTWPGQVTLRILPPPLVIQSFEARDPTNQNAIFDSGDQLFITFNQPTNQPSIGSRERVDAVFEFRPSLPGIYVGSWSSPTTAVISFINLVCNSTVCNPPEIGNTTVRVKFGAVLRDSTQLAYPSTAESPRLGGSWGAFKRLLAWSIPDFALILVVAFTAVSFVACVILLVVLNYYSSHPIITASSLYFCNLIVVGSMFALALPLLWTFMPGRIELCYITPLLAGISFSFIFGSLLAKNWRLYKVFGNTELNVVVISNTELLRPILLMVCCEIAFVIIWSLSSPPRIVTFADANNEYELSSCSFLREWVFFLVFCLCQFSLLIFGSFLSVKLRKLPRRFNESVWVGLSIYNMTILSVFMLPLARFLETQALAHYIFCCLGVVVYVLSNLALLFGPKIIKVFQPPEESSEAKFQGGTPLNRLNSIPTTMISKRLEDLELELQKVRDENSDLRQRVSSMSSMREMSSSMSRVDSSSVGSREMATSNNSFVGGSTQMSTQEMAPVVVKIS